ncbi:polar growth protein [Irineochytrium annulatum]|nr:polar growth protein [Irineochytrium annulatum]
MAPGAGELSRRPTDTSSAATVTNTGSSDGASGSVDALGAGSTASTSMAVRDEWVTSQGAEALGVEVACLNPPAPQLPPKAGSLFYDLETSPARGRNGEFCGGVRAARVGWGFSLQRTMTRCRNSAVMEEMMNPLLWTREQVGVWLEASGYGPDIVRSFATHNINGARLIRLNANVLKTDIGIKSFGLRGSILASIDELCSMNSVRKPLTSTGDGSLPAYHE